MTGRTLPPWHRWEKDGLRLEIATQAGSRRDGTNGIHGGRLRLRVAAPAVEGKANRRLVEWLASEFRVARSQVRLLRGELQRDKSLLIQSPRSVPDWFLALGGSPPAK